MIDILNKRTYTRRFVSLAAILLIFLFTTAYMSNTGRQIIRIRDGKSTSFEDMVDEASSVRAIFIGESHNNPAHHRIQLDVIRSLHERGDDLAIGLEMFKKENQKSLDNWIAGKIPEGRFIPIFLQNWGFDWALYRDIFLYAREHEIPLVGLNVPHEITRKVAKTGFLSLTDEERIKLPPGVTCELDQEYMDHLKRVFQYKEHGDSSFVYFCEAQVLWDQAMAWYLTEYMNNNPGKNIVVLAGAMHAWKYGIPKQKLRYTSSAQIVIIPDLPAPPASININDADYVILHS